MNPEAKTETNVKLAVPFFGVTSMDASYRFYVDGLGFVMTKHWTVDGKIRWCWLEMGATAIMLQEYLTQGHDSWKPEGKLGVGVTISFQCMDALAIFHAVTARGINASRPFVSNNMWVTTVFDPDGYRLEFESPTDVAEGTEYTG